MSSIISTKSYTADSLPLFKRKGIRTTVSLSVLLLLILLPAFASARDNGYMRQLIARAREKGLDRSRYWDVLLHYKKTTSGVKSYVDDPRFFLSPEGKTNPRAELEATIKAFFSTKEKGDNHPRCRFIGRYYWLKDKLKIDESRLPRVKCAKFEKVMKKLRHPHAVLVFPASNMNNPASMFGHTLLRVDRKGQSKLLSYAVTYSATNTDPNGFLFAVKGIFGFYKGYFSILPYYDKVKEYNDMDQRDIWEYGLNLSEAEVRRMVRHIWELQDIYSWYYFFNENCSYELLFLLEAARPSLHLTGAFGPSVIPVDTIKLARKLGIASSPEYRPSQVTVIKTEVSDLGPDKRPLWLAKRIAMGSVEPETVLSEPMPEKEKAKVLGLAADLIQYRYVKRKITKKKYMQAFLDTLDARGQLGITNTEPPVEPPAAPEKGHGSKRLAPGFGVRGGKLFAEIKFRPAYHDLLDPDEGYTEGSQIDFMSGSLRYYFEGHKLKLERLDLVNIKSVSPRDSLFKPISWMADVGLGRKLFPSGRKELVFFITPGAGYARSEGLPGTFYFFLEPDFNLSPNFQSGYALGGGAEAGFLTKLSRDWKADLDLRAMDYLAGDSHSEFRVKLAQTYRLTRNNALALTVDRVRSFSRYQSEAVLNWNFYF